MAAAQTLSFAALLKRHRRAAGLTQERLGERAGYSVNYISLLERGRRLPIPATVELLAVALGLGAAERVTLLEACHTVKHSAVIPPPRSETRPLRLVGRTRELTRLERHLAGKLPPLLLLSGEPGIGKTRLLQEIAQRAQERGLQVLSGGCNRRSGQEPYAPLLGAIEGYIRHRPPAELRPQLEGCAWLVRLLPELAETAIMPVPRWGLAPEQERRLMFGAVGRFLSNVAGRAGTLLVLDDLQWAGDDALDLLATLVRSAAEMSLRVVGAYRDTDIRPEDPLTALLADLAGGRLAAQVRLGPLTPGEATELLDELLEPGEGSEASAETDPAQREQLLQRSEGVPFFLVSCAQAVRLGILDDGAGNSKSVPWDAAQSIRQRIAVLPEAAREMLGIAAVGGRRIRRSVLLAVAAQLGHDVREAPTALEAACQARLLTEEGEEAYQFAHDLIREVAIADLSAARRALLHQQVAEALEREPGEPPIEVLAFHYRRAGNREKAVVYLERAGDRAWALHANAEAEGHYRELVERLDGLGRPAQAAQGREKLAATLHTVARYEEALEVLGQAVEAYRTEGDLEGQGRAIALIGQVHALRGTPEAGIVQLQALTESPSASGLSADGLAAVYIALAHLYVANGRYRDQLTAAERAAEHARPAHNDRLLAQAEKNRGTALLMLGRDQEGRQVLEEAIPLLEAVDDLRNLSHALNNLSVVHETRGKFEQARAYVDRALEVAERLGDPSVTAFMMQRRARNAFYLGNWADAHESYETAIATMGEFSTSWFSPYPLLGQGALCLAEGQWEAASRHLQEGTALAERAGDLQALRWAASTLAERDLLAGDPERARARLDPLLDRPGQQEADVTILLAPLAWAYVSLGNEDEAQRLLSRAMDHTSSENNRLDLVDVLRIQAMLAARQGRWMEAERALEQALALVRAMRYPYAEAKASYVYGQLHVQQGATAQARERLEAALAILRRLGERLYAEHVERALADLGRRV